MSRSSSIDRLVTGPENFSVNMSEIGSVRNCFSALKMSVFEKPTENFFDVKSNKKLGYILQNGYSCRHHEKSQYNNKKCAAAYLQSNREFLNVSMQNRSMLEYLHQPKGEGKQPQLNMSASGQSLYADLFNERYKNLTKSIADSMREPEKPEESKPGEEMTEAKATEELNNAKRNRVYKDLGLNLNLKEIFSGMDYNELKKLKKLHVLYAAQRIRAKALATPSAAAPSKPAPAAPPEAEVKAEAKPAK